MPRSIDVALDPDDLNANKFFKIRILRVDRDSVYGCCGRDEAIDDLWPDPALM